MGYTQYLDVANGPFIFTAQQWEELRRGCDEVFRLCKEQGVELACDCDEPAIPPMANADTIWFNGVGDEGHETFVIERTMNEWCFCKTARKPYDIAVTAILAYLHTTLGDHLVVSSDGEAMDWLHGIDLANEAWPHIKIENPITDDYP